MKRSIAIALSVVAFSAIAYTVLDFLGISGFSVPGADVSVLENIEGTILWKGNPPTAADYTQDGLIAMWDGIENVDWGVHSDTTNRWNDLIKAIPGQNLVVKPAYHHWEDDCCVAESVDNYSDGMMCAYNGQMYDAVKNGYTLEVCVYCPTYGSSTARCLFCIGSSGFLCEGYNGNWRYSVYCPGVSYTTTYFNTKSIKYTTLSATFDVPNSTTKRYISGIIRNTFNSSGVSGTNTTARYLTSGINMQNNGTTGRAWQYGKGNGTKYFCARVYSRVLSAEEIAWNYSIDKIRFNLP